MLVRCFSIIQALQGNCAGLSLAELASKLSVSERTIRRDLNGLEEAHVPLVREMHYGIEAPKWALVSVCCPVCSKRNAPPPSVGAVRLTTDQPFVSIREETSSGS